MIAQPKPRLVPMLPVKPFDLEAALAGALFIHRFDAVRPDAWTRVSTTIVKIDDPTHPAFRARSASAKRHSIASWRNTRRPKTGRKLNN